MARLQMHPYANRSGSSGVVAYAAGPGWIVIEFAASARDRNRFYRYTAASAGADRVRELQRRARQGRWLSTFVSQTHPGYDARSPLPLDPPDAA